LPGLRLAAAGLEGSDAHPAIQTPEANAIAPAMSAALRSTSAVRLQRSPQGSTLESGRPSRRRARGPGGQPSSRPPAGSSVPRGKRKALRPLAASQKSVSARSLEPAFRIAGQQPAPRQRLSPEGTRRRRWLGGAKRNRARSPARVGRQYPSTDGSSYITCVISSRTMRWRYDA
jgi:hypothetical protein